MRVVFAGTPAVALPSLEALLASAHDVIAVITRPDAPAGRGRRTAASPVAELARAAGIETRTPSTPKDPAFQGWLRSVAPDSVPVVAYGALVPPDALEIPTHGWVNLHFSLLPAWRGAAPVQHAILHGDEVTGASTFRLEAGLDTGPVYGVVTERIRPRDTSGELLGRLAVSGAQLLLATLDGIERGECAPVPQPAEGVSLAPKLGVEDVRVDWAAPAQHVDRLVRAAAPTPGAWTTFRGRRLKLGPVEVLTGSDVPAPTAPGQVADLPGLGVVAGTATAPVRLGRVQPEGKAAMDAASWARGMRLEDADVLV
ncbi:MAG TPA: methionyl-tRNA formyltransferase [Mycobacteriales bacterium]|nr:methionyl-tRNA formyltransferase [Mycobacteriales bacterium]